MDNKKRASATKIGSFADFEALLINFWLNRVDFKYWKYKILQNIDFCDHYLKAKI